MGNDIYTVLHHTVDKLGARDEAHLRDLHDTITAQQLGYGSLEELRAEQRRALIAVDPQAAAAAQRQAYELLETVKQQQQLIQTLLSQAAEFNKAQADNANRAAVEAQGSIDANAAPIFPTQAPASSAAAESAPLTPSAKAPALPVAPAAPEVVVAQVPAEAVAPAAPAPARQVPLPPTGQP